MSIPGVSTTGESVSDSSDCSISSHTSSGSNSSATGTEESSSSDWDVTSSDNDSSDDTTLDPFGYSHSRIISASIKSSEYESSYFDPNTNNNNNTQEGEISNYDGINTVTDSRMPYLLKM
eukprot:49381_1